MMYVHTLFGFETDSVVDWLVTSHLVCTDVHKTDGFTGSNNCCDILVDGKILHIVHRLLRHSRHRSKQHNSRRTEDTCKFHIILIYFLHFVSNRLQVHIQDDNQLSSFLPFFRG